MSGNGQADSRKEGGSQPPAARFPSAFVLIALVALIGGGVFWLRARTAKPPMSSGVAGAARAAPPVPVDVADGDMLQVLGGSFQMGSTEGDPDEVPVTTVTVRTFLMDAIEVTVAAFARCVAAGKCSEPDTGMYCNWRKPGRERHPVNCVDLKQGTDYCASIEKRLPTEEEWEYAARGTDGRKYPWKDGAPAAQLCWSGPGNDLGTEPRDGTCPVASYPGGVSPFGVFDMAGNVWEWTASAHCPYDRRGCESKERVVRGGAWNNFVPQYVRAQDRAVEAAVARRDNVGFRCVRSPS